MSATSDSAGRFGPWNPGILSQIPRELRPLSTILRPENVVTSLGAAEELHGLTGFPLSELVQFRPQRLALHELLVRVTADFSVPDGTEIGDLGINFRRIASRILSEYLDPEMDKIADAYDRARDQAKAAAEAAIRDAVFALVPAAVPRGPASAMRFIGRKVLATRAGAPAGRSKLGSRSNRRLRTSGRCGARTVAASRLSQPRAGSVGLVRRQRACLGHARTHRIGDRRPRLQ